MRFFAMKNDLDNYKYPVTEYLTRYLEKITLNRDNSFDYEKEREIFEQTFKFIKDNWEKDAFSGKTRSGNIKNEFVLYYFDGITVSIASLIEEILKNKDKTKEIVECINNIKEGNELKSYKTGSVSGVKARIKLFMEGVNSIIDDR